MRERTMLDSPSGPNRTESSDKSGTDRRVRATTFVQDLTESKGLLHIEFVRQDTRECMIAKSAVQATESAVLPDLATNENGSGIINCNDPALENELETSAENQLGVTENSVQINDEASASPETHDETNSKSKKSRSSPESDLDVKSALRKESTNNNVDVRDSAKRDENKDGVETSGMYIKRDQSSSDDENLILEAIEREVTYGYIKMFNIPQDLRENPNIAVFDNFDAVQNQAQNQETPQNGSGDGDDAADAFDSTIIPRNRQIPRANTVSLVRTDNPQQSPFDEELIHLSQSNSDPGANSEEQSRYYTRSLLENQQDPESEHSRNFSATDEVSQNQDEDLHFHEKDLNFIGQNESDDNYSDCSFASSTGEHKKSQSKTSQKLRQQQLVKNEYTDDAVMDDTDDSGRRRFSLSVESNGGSDVLVIVRPSDSGDISPYSPETEALTEGNYSNRSVFSNESGGMQIEISKKSTGMLKTHSEESKMTRRKSEAAMKKNTLLPPIEHKSTKPKKSQKKSFSVRQKALVNVCNENQDMHSRRPGIPHQLKADALWIDGKLDITIRGPKGLLPPESCASKGRKESNKSSRRPMDVNITFVETNPQSMKSRNKKLPNLTFTYNHLYAKRIHSRRYSDTDYDLDVISSRAIGTPFNTRMTPDRSPRLPLSRLPSLKHGYNFADSSLSTNCSFYHR